MRRTSIVARPTGVFPANSGPSQKKCSSHRSFRGLKSGVSCSVSMSKPATLLPLEPLQCAHAMQVFSRVVTPRCFLARIWSTSWGRTLKPWESRQYSHRPLARSQMSLFRNLAINYCIDFAWRSERRALAWRMSMNLPTRRNFSKARRSWAVMVPRLFL
jgi:hypothetical protein